MNAAPSWSRQLLRIGSDARHDRWLDYLWILGACGLLIATGIGLRDPWPADEPRFALIARDMVASGEWLVPRVGGDLYSDKPPLFFWLIAAFLSVTGSLRIAFLMPSFLSAVGCVLLVYDLASRLWRREVGLVAALALLFTVQFVWQARQAQIDGTLCFWTTLSLHGLLRHLLLGPRWGWYAIGWAAAGFGVITKGVGFLPLLILIPFALLRSLHWRPEIAFDHPLRWLLGPLSFCLAVSTWLVPMLVAAADDGALAAYRDEIPLQQTVERYTNAWHHREPFWYFILNVIPALWLPLTALLPWLVPKWKDAIREHDLRIALLLSWILFVVAFFSLSAGKRGVYVLPAVPAFALASAPYLIQLFERKSVQRVMYVLSLAIAILCAVAAIILLLDAGQRHEFISRYGLDPLPPIALIVTAVLVLTLLASPRRGAAAYCSSLTAVLLTVSFWVNPTMNSARSGADFVRRVENVADPQRELGWVAFREQYLLQSNRTVVHFGHARWREAEQEAFDAARWLYDSPRRQLIVDASASELCFANASVEYLGAANRERWFLIQGQPDPQCVSEGQTEAAYAYTPPGSSPPAPGTLQPPKSKRTGSWRGRRAQLRDGSIRFNVLSRFT